MQGYSFPSLLFAISRLLLSQASGWANPYNTLLKKFKGAHMLWWIASKTIMISFCTEQLANWNQWLGCDSLTSIWSKICRTTSGSDLGSIIFDQEISWHQMRDSWRWGWRITGCSLLYHSKLASTLQGFHTIKRRATHCCISTGLSHKFLKVLDKN